ncbi:MAG TPA: DNA-processing protein DprA [Candidatus Saccharimonadales bacterium]|nr:DNA-processing protein DprA [Candidatus Saccharimonadales bacterium]
MGREAETAGEIRAVGKGEDGYPEGLEQLGSAPDPVFLAGRWDHPGPFVAIVGTRDASDDGRDVARDLARALAQRGVAILSGLARGIDAAAHEGALAADGVSGAVLGTPLDVTYPREHASLHDRLRRSLGLMSEIRSGDPTTRNTFAARNRLLAALSDAVVVVQGRQGSGALLTADAASRLGRPVGAVPWDSRDPLGEAPHRLIREGKARLVCTAEDILDLIASRGEVRSTPREVMSRRSRAIPKLLGHLAPHERALYRALRERPRPMDELAQISGLTAAQLGIALVALELHGLATRDPGGSARRRVRRS